MHTCILEKPAYLPTDMHTYACMPALLRLYMCVNSCPYMRGSTTVSTFSTPKIRVWWLLVFGRHTKH